MNKVAGTRTMTPNFTTKSKENKMNSHRITTNKTRKTTALALAGTIGLGTLFTTAFMAPSSFAGGCSIDYATVNVTKVSSADGSKLAGAVFSATASTTDSSGDGEKTFVGSGSFGQEGWTQEQRDLFDALSASQTATQDANKAVTDAQAAVRADLSAAVQNAVAHFQERDTFHKAEIAKIQPEYDAQAAILNQEGAANRDAKTAADQAANSAYNTGMAPFNAEIARLSGIMTAEYQNMLHWQAEADRIAAEVGSNTPTPEQQAAYDHAIDQRELASNAYYVADTELTAYRNTNQAEMNAITTTRNEALATAQTAYDTEHQRILAAFATAAAERDAALAEATASRDADLQAAQAAVDTANQAAGPDSAANIAADSRVVAAKESLAAADAEYQELSAQWRTERFVHVPANSEQTEVTTGPDGASFEAYTTCANMELSEIKLSEVKAPEGFNLDNSDLGTLVFDQVTNLWTIQGAPENVRADITTTSPDHHFIEITVSNTPIPEEPVVPDPPVMTTTTQQPTPPVVTTTTQQPTPPVVTTTTTKTRDIPTSVPAGS